MNEFINLYRRNGKNIYIKQPSFEELSFVARLWGDEETMADIGGTYLFPKEKWSMFYKKMVYPTDNRNFYCIVYTIRDKAIGEVSFHGYDSATKIARINVKIHHRYRNKGYGEEAIRLLLEYYFLEFGGEVIIDTIKTESGKRTFSKIGFEPISNFKNQITYKITKGQFLNKEMVVKKSIAILAYDKMDIAEYSIPFQIFEKANSIIGKDLFDVYGVSYKQEIEANNKIKVAIENEFEDGKNPDIIIIPGGVGAEVAVKDKYIIRYILSNYNNCDYLMSSSTGLYFLNRCRMLDGIFIPTIKEMEEYLKELEFGSWMLDKNYIDNGKIIISSNILGEIEGCLNIVNKIAGVKVAKQIYQEIGLLQYLKNDKKMWE